MAYTQNCCLVRSLAVTCCHKTEDCQWGMNLPLIPQLVRWNSLTNVYFWYWLEIWMESGRIFMTCCQFCLLKKTLSSPLLGGDILQLFNWRPLWQGKDGFGEDACDVMTTGIWWQTNSSVEETCCTRWHRERENLEIRNSVWTVGRYRTRLGKY